MKKTIMENKADNFFKKYRSQVEMLESKSLLSKVRSVTPMDIVALGSQLDMFDMYSQSVCEEAGNVNLLGKLPHVAHDVITASYGSSFLPAIATVQPIEEEVGSVYFKQLRSSQAKGNMAEGEVFVDPRTGIKVPVGVASSRNEIAAAATTVAAQATYAIALGKAIKSESLYVEIAGTEVKGRDQGEGKIWGNGISGTVDYITGAVSVTLADDSSNGENITVVFYENYELAEDLPQIDAYMASKSISAVPYVLKSTMGMFQQFSMQKRFGMAAADEMAKDLIAAINMEVGGDCIRKLVAARAANGNAAIQFDRTAPAGVSYFEHKMTYADRVADAEAQILSQAGRGSIQALIVGRKHAAVIKGLPDFTPLSNGQSMGSHIFGTLNGMTVIRVTDPNILGEWDGLALHKGASPFEAACVYAPYLPLTTTDLLPEGNNGIVSQKAAALMAGVETLVPQFVTGLEVTNS
jgi:hypothetical protein